ncbi:MAG: hypothetical protein PHF83_03585 [Candidatus Methanomethylophilus sp.]|nr:hypothetical protein [Methanomethylophilus sp.]
MPDQAGIWKFQKLFGRYADGITAIYDISDGAWMLTVCSMVSRQFAGTTVKEVFGIINRFTGFIGITDTAVSFICGWEQPDLRIRLSKRRKHDFSIQASYRLGQQYERLAGLFVQV